MGSFVLKKMKTEIHNPVNYFLVGENENLFMNSLVGEKVHLKFENEIYCLGCGNKISKTFAQGYCYPCLLSSPETEECVLRPELCQAHNGISRDMDYAREHCLQDHYVYLAASPEIKVGVTRSSQIPTRWIDQGASFAIQIAKTPNRYIAGVIEVELKKFIADKTNWRNMLTGVQANEENLIVMQKEVAKRISPENSTYLLSGNSVTEIKYPVMKYPQKVLPVDLDKTNDLNAVLTGIKGQYLLFDTNQVLNIRKYGGYKITID
jgi:hypothetical protein